MPDRNAPDRRRSTPRAIASDAPLTAVTRAQSEFADGVTGVADGVTSVAFRVNAVTAGPSPVSSGLIPVTLEPTAVTDPLIRVG